MNKDEFLKLPPRMALGYAWDALRLDDLLRTVQAPRTPLPPKYDLKVYRKGGHVWASEMTLESLEYWHKKAKESAASGGKYAEKDAKKASNLERWINWRQCDPDSRWSGERDHDRVTAAAPSREPQLHESGTKPAAGDEPFTPAPGEPDEFGDVPF